MKQSPESRPGPRALPLQVAVIGGGAAGFFAAIAVKENHPAATITIFEKSKRLLAKVRISGGGRCNVTNACDTIQQLAAAYPRGGKALRKAFRLFDNRQAMQWFESRGVPLVVQEDGCVFPASQQSQSIIDCLLSQAKKYHVRIETGMGVTAIRPLDGGLSLDFAPPGLAARVFDKVIVTTGGCPKRHNLQWLEDLGHKIETPVPSLFTFNMPTEPVTALMGIVVEKTLVGIQGSKLKADGPLLITHWGMSGPAILKLSAFGARLLSERDYRFNIQVNWANIPRHDGVMADLKNIAEKHSQKHLSSIRPYDLPDRLWRYLLEKSGLPAQKRWSELGNKGLNKLVEVLTNDVYAVQGKTTFREEFVTCGGVSLESVDVATLQSRVCNNLYFAGELLDIDGITGGYNFQAAWTTGYIAGKLQ